MSANTTTAPPLDDVSTRSSAAPAPAQRRRRLSWQRLSRLAHVYTSMIALLVILFFGLTGVTLNHPDWTLGFDPSSADLSGTLPADAVAEDGSVAFLTLSEFLRVTHDISADVNDWGSDAETAWISYRGPGYAADATVDLTDDTYEVHVEQQGWIGVMNDLHKGRSTGTSWSWLIDVSGGFLVVVALSGLLLQLFVPKRRKAALVVAGVGTAIVVALVIVAVT